MGRDAADFVGRAPVPAFHLLREEQVSLALSSLGADKEAVGRQIAERNARHLRRRGWAACLADLRACGKAAGVGRRGSVRGRARLG